MTDGTVDFGGDRVRPELVGEVVELELMLESLERGAQHHTEHGGKAECGCSLTIDGHEPALHRNGCPKGRQGLCSCTGSQHDRGCQFSMQRWQGEST